MRIGPDDEGVLVDRAAFEAAGKKRGVSLGIAPAVQDVLEAFAQQQEDGKETLFMFYNGKQFACAGAFFVEKSNGLRIIVGAREANAWIWAVSVDRTRACSPVLRDAETAFVPPSNSRRFAVYPDRRIT